MARKPELCRKTNGLFMRSLGWKSTGTGYAQHKFYLGRDEHKATVANLRLEQLWEQVQRRWEREKKCFTNPTDRPVWDEVTISIAEAVRSAVNVARVPLPLALSAMVPESPLIAHWFDQLQADFSFIKIEIDDSASQKVTEEVAQKEGQRLVEMGRKLILRKLGGETLHAALDAYCKWIKSKYLTLEKTLTAWGSTQTRQVTFIRQHTPNVPLAEMGTEQIDALIDVLRMRPLGEGKKPVSVSWTRNCIKQFRHFLRWLNKTNDFAWKRPADLETNTIHIPVAKEEMSAALRRTQVQTYSIDDLRMLWEYATPFQRLLMLLALNCGFGRAEIASLEIAELHLRQKHPHESEIGCPCTENDSWILRVRHKSGVYGEWKLWPETASAIDWWQRQRSSIPEVASVSTLLVTKKGNRYDAVTKGNHPNFQIPNGWISLTKRIRKDHATFRLLSFNKLRKTAGNLIRSAGDGEIAGVFLCHGTPVEADKLLDAYTNRPFAKVFQAIEIVGERLRPLWATVTDPFPDQRKQGGSNISLALIRRIQSMKRQGYKTSYIAEKLDVSTETVRRWARRQNEDVEMNERAGARGV